MNKCLIVGGSNGIGLAIATQCAQVAQSVIIVDRVEPDGEMSANVTYRSMNLLNND